MPACTRSFCKPRQKRAKCKTNREEWEPLFVCRIVIFEAKSLGEVSINHRKGQLKFIYLCMGKLRWSGGGGGGWGSFPVPLASARKTGGWIHDRISWHKRQMSSSMFRLISIKRPILVFELYIYFISVFMCFYSIVLTEWHFRTRRFSSQPGDLIKVVIFLCYHPYKIMICTWLLNPLVKNCGEFSLQGHNCKWTSLSSNKVSKVSKVKVFSFHNHNTRLCECRITWHRYIKCCHQQ
jgi:hypothetical protein